jgi:hypothetical protein
VHLQIYQRQSLRTVKFIQVLSSNTQNTGYGSCSYNMSCGSCSSAHVVVETPHWVGEVEPAGPDAVVEVVVVAVVAVAAAG